MTEVTRILNAIDAGNAQAANDLLPLVYNELRRLAAQKLSQEKPGQTLQATALVHEAYIRLVRSEDRRWDGQRHFFASAAEAMRRILVENARHKKSLKAGGGARRVDLDHVEVELNPSTDGLLALDDALTKLTRDDPAAANLAKLRLFAGLTVDEAAASLGVSHTTGFRQWTYARAYLQTELRAAEQE
jgi:RNA polymerase sigma factor (TIGR02999 family)